jgi:hypothetical protein
MSKIISKYGEYVALLQNSRAVISISNSKNVLRTKNKATIDGFNYEKFGSDDRLPDEILTAIWQNDFMPQLLHTEASFLHGAGLGVFRKRIVAGTAQYPAKEIIEPVYDESISKWMEQVHLEDYWLRACTQFVAGANVYTGFNLNIEGKPVELNVYDWPTMRSEIRNEKTGQIDAYLLFGERVVKNGDKIKVQRIERYYQGIENHKSQFIFHATLPTSGQSNYGLPMWFGALETIKVLNRIPQFHSSGIDNGYNVKYHVKVPSVFLDQFGSQEEKDKAWSQLQYDMDEMLCGAANVNKTILSKVFIDPMTNKPLPAFDIVPLQQVETGKQYLELSKDFRINAASSVGIHPNLANVDVGGKLGGSASEMRIAAQLHMTLRTPIPRAILMKPIKIAMKLMGFAPDLFIAPKDVELTTLDNNPTGSQSVTTNANVPA